MVVETANYVPFEIFGTKTVLLKLNCKLLRTLSWKNRAFSQKVFFRVFTTEFRASREMFWGKKDLSFEKVLFFCYHFWSLSDFFVFCAKFFSQVCQTTDQRAERNKMGKLTWKTCFFNQFWTLRKNKTWFFSKTVRHDSQNCSLPGQLTNFRNFSGSKNICMKVFGPWTETSEFQRKGFLRVFKGAFKVSSATLWEKDDEREFYILCPV